MRNRSSADTFIIDEEPESRNSRDDPQVSKKTTEELLEELGEPTKSLKECLAFEYSEPPCAVREVLNDFETESEDSDKEPQMHIAENIPVIVEGNVNEEIIIVDAENIDSVVLADEERILVEGGMEVDIGPTFDHEIITAVTSTNFGRLNNWVEGCDQSEQEVPLENKSVKETTAEQNEDTGRNESSEETEAQIVEESEPIIVEHSEGVTETPKEKKKPDSENNNFSSLNATSDTIIPNNQEVLDATKSQKTSSKFDILAPLKDALRKRSTSPDKIVSKKKKKLDCGTEPQTNGDAIEVTPPSSNNTEAIFEALKKSDKPVEDSTMQDAQDIEEAPQIKNPCLKSVSLFEEQFNTTKYSDSEEDTPIPNNAVKTIENTATVDDNQSKIAKDLTPDHKKEVTDPSVGENQRETKETNASVEKKQNETDLPDTKQKRADKKHDESTKSDAPIQKNQEDIIMLKSDSDSDVEPTPRAEKRKQRFKNLAHAFGFVPGEFKRSMLCDEKTFWASKRACSFAIENEKKTLFCYCFVNILFW